MATTVQLTEEGTSKYVQAGDIKLHYNEAGVGETLICLHGGGPGASGWSNYVANISPLSQQYRTILLDLPGFGKSDPVAIEGSRFAYNAKAIKDLLDALGIQKAHLIGNSMGGGSSAQFAIDYPDRLGKLVLMGPAGMGRSHFNPLPLEGIKVLNEVFANPTMDGFRQLIRLFVYDSSFMTDELLEQRLKATLDHPEHLEARRNSTRGLPDISGEIHKIQAETLIIWGRDDLFSPLDHAFKMMWHIPNARVHIFSKCGHWAQYEKAGEFNNLVLKFFSY